MTVAYTAQNAGLPNDLSWKIFVDRYTKKDLARAFQSGDLAIVQTGDDPKWPTKELAQVDGVKGGRVSLRLLTGTQAGDMLEVLATRCDRPLETTLSDVAARVAAGVAAVEPEARRDAVAADFAAEIQALRFVPGGRVWAGAGTNVPVTLFNCFVLPSPGDSRQGIVQTLGQMIEIMARGGGVGITVSSLRPFRTPVRGVNGRSSGPVSWMDLYSRAAGLVEQGGSRRGALMLQMDIWHPDVWSFIDAKKQQGMVENANISLRISNAFMNAVKTGGIWNLVFPDTQDPAYDAEWTGDLAAWREAGHAVTVHETVDARKLWRAITDSAWQCAEPGIVFSDRHEQDSNSWYFNPLICTNPCAEQPLPAWGVCTLGHVNLANMLRPDGEVDWETLHHTVQTGIRFLDDVVDATPYFIAENEANQKRERRIGLGTMGVAELLIRAGLRYGSEKAETFLDRIFSFIRNEAYLASIQLAAEKGPFPAFHRVMYLESGFIKRLPPAIREQIGKHGIRNVTCLTQAPTGTVGTMMNTSTGIEPFFSFKYFRQSRLGYDEQWVPLAEDWLKAHPGEKLPDYFVSAMQLTPEDHIRVQAVAQRYTDSSISKTANAPNSYTREQTADLYMLAYDSGCKGVTIYRDGSRSEQVLHDATVQKDAAPTPPVPVPALKPRPEELRGRTIKVKAPEGSVFVTLNDGEDGRPFEVFAQAGKAGSDLSASVEAIARLASLALRSGIAPATLVDQLEGIGGRSVGFGPKRVRSIADAIAYAMRQVWMSQKESTPSLGAKGDLCPKCGQYTLVHQDGCEHCPCGHSAC